MRGWALLLGLMPPAAAAAAQPPAPPPQAAPVTPPPPKPAKTPPRRLAPTAPPAAPVWPIDKPNSRISFKGALGADGFDGVFKKWDAQIAFDPANLKGSRLLLVLETGSAITGHPATDHALAAPGWFGSKKYPKAVFVSRSIAQTSSGHYEAAGDLRLRGAARKLSFPFVLSVVNNAGRIEGVLTLDRTVFGRAPAAAPGAPTPGDPPLVIAVRLSAKKGR